MSKLLIIDTYALIFRAYYAYPSLSTADGTPSGAIFGFLQMLLTTLDKIQPDYFVCSLESETPTFRHVLSAEYKANRKEPDHELSSKIVEVINILNTLGIKTLYKDGFEADDVIGSFATQNQDKFDEIEIITGDRDLLQLLSERIKVLMPGRFFSDLVSYDRQRFEEKFGVVLEDFVLYKSMIGDSSDNIKGIPGVGPKTAVKIINEYHSIDSILANLDQLPPRIATSIDEYKDMWRDFYKLCKIDTDIKLDVEPEDTKISKIKAYKLREIVDRFELTSLKNRVAKFIDSFEAKHGGFGLFEENPENSDEVKVSELRYFMADKVVFEDETTPDSPPLDKGGELKGRLETNVIDKQAYVVYSEKFIRLGNDSDFMEVPESELYNFVITNNIKTFIGFDLKPFIKKLYACGIEQIENFAFYDLKLAWHLIKHDLKLDNINDLVKYLSKDNYKDLLDETISKLKEEDMEKLFELEKNLQKVIGHMEFTGICVNREHLNKLAKVYAEVIDKTKKEMFDFVGFEFNPASTKDLGHVLFEVLHLPVIKKTKTQYSTDDSTLSKLEGQSDIIPMIKKFRAYSKALSTYVIGYEKYIGEDGKIHTTFNQAQVATGRLSSINPNLQNLPANENIGNDIRQAFVPSNEEKVFLSFDYSQIDLRVLAFESKDPGLIEAFKNDEDIHTTTMRLILEKEEITKDERSFGKTINFGIVYGMEAFGLAQRLGIEHKAAKEFIEKYFEKFKGVKDYFETIRKQLDEKEYVNTFLGRKRHFRSWKNMRGFQKQMLFREAINMPVQGGSSELIKIAMIKIFEYIRTSKIQADLIIQIHDELVMEISKKDNTQKFQEDIKEIMTNAYDIGIPLKVNVKEGRDLNF